MLHQSRPAYLTVLFQYLLQTPRLAVSWRLSAARANTASWFYAAALCFEAAAKLPKDGRSTDVECTIKAHD